MHRTAAIIAALVCVVLLLSAAQARIIDFQNDPNDSWRNIHVHSEAMYSYKKGQTSRPSITFTVKCPKTSKPVYISWMVVATNINGIARMVNQPADTPPDSDVGFSSARCNATPLKCTGSRRRGDDDTTTALPTSAALPTTAIPTTVDSATTGAAESTTANPSQTAPTPMPTPAPVYSINGSDVGCGAAGVMTGKQNPLDEDVCCAYASGLYYVPARVHDIVVGGCLMCAHGSPEHKVHQEMTRDGLYTLWVESSFDADADKSKQGPAISGESTFLNTHGYLSAQWYPLLIFYGLMGLVYLCVGLLWLVLMVCYYQDLLRLQFWIGAVVALGMLEMAVSFGDLDYINRTGTRSKFLMIFAKLLFASKNTLARLLVLFVSLGYGVVKPRLGGYVKQIVAVGCSYFFFSAAYGVSHANVQDTNDDADTKAQMMVIIPLSVLDAFICWWIFLSLSHTQKILKLRNNKTKLELYERFTWALVVCVTATVVFAIWSLYDRFGSDPYAEVDWRNAWWQDAFWHLLFFTILTVIMVLWRPSTNNSRYAFSVLETDFDEDDEYNNVVPNFGGEAMKMRSLSQRGQPSPPPLDDIEDDLKWVEENIPASVVSGGDGVFPSFPMDSDEEMMHTRFEMSKME